MYNYQIVNTDTDSISFCKPNDKFNHDEIKKLLNEINELSPDFMVWEDDGHYETVIVFKAKNYVLFDGKKITLKGSGLKSATLEPIIKQMLMEMIDALVFDKQDALPSIYIKYVKMVDNITDIKPWSKKMQLSPTTFQSERKNETKVVDAIAGSEYKSGDRIYVYPRPDDTLRLAERFDGEYCKDTYYEKLYKATERFKLILPIKDLFKNYSLKRNKKDLEQLLIS